MLRTGPVGNLVKPPFQCGPSKEIKTGQCILMDSRFVKVF